ncbi:MAG: nucleoside 2-deoxyribosyltransferase [Candidatus Woesearchaeota archaeon]
MKIYFACSIDGGRTHAHLYPEIVEHLKNFGEVLTEYFSDDNRLFKTEKGRGAHEIFERDMNWIDQSSVIIAEVSTPSLGVGFEIATVLNQGKPIICLYKKQDNKKLSAMIAGNKNLHTIKYDTLEEAKQKIDEFFSNLKNENLQ